MDPGISVPPALYGGHERMVHLFATEYSRLGHQVTLLAGPGSSCEGETITFGVNDLDRSKAQRYKEILFVWKYLLNNHQNFDAIHNFGRLIYLLPILNKKVKKVMSYGRRVSPFGIRLINYLPSKNLIFTACSDYCVNTGKVAGKWVTVYNSIEFDKYTATPNVSDDAPLVFLSRLDIIKGPHVAINVALKTGNKLIIAGNEPSTPDNTAYYEKYVKPFIDQKQIAYIGEVNDQQKNELLGKGKAMLFPLCGDEAFGLVMIESMACGTPVIAFNHAAAPEVVNEGISGFITNNEEEMIAAIEKISLIDRGKCREIAEERFDVKSIVNDYLILLS